MFFDDLAQIPALAQSTGVAIFVVPPETKLDLGNALEITKPADKKNIAIEQVREILDFVSNKQKQEQYIIIRQAELLSASAANALLKLLEEPKEHYHFLLLTTEPYALLPTILSRAELYCLRQEHPLSTQPAATEAELSLAKKLLVATPAQLPALADELAKQKPNPREQAIKVAAVAVELAYKSYFATQNPKFLQPIPGLIQLHQSLAQGGNLKLHIVADLC